MFGRDDQDVKEPRDPLAGILGGLGQAGPVDPNLPVSGGPVGVAGPVNPGQPGQAGPQSQYADRPRELHPGGGPPSLGGMYGATPSQSDEPNPAAAGMPHPFTPMQPPMLPAGASPNASRFLFGRAGGLLGGGLGVPGILGDEGGNEDDVAALMHLMSLGGGGEDY